MIFSFLICTVLVSCFVEAIPEEVFGLPPIRNIPPKFQTHNQNRIYGGEEVKPHSIPYQVALYTYTATSSSAAFCGGSIISERYLLTAAHCLWKKVRAEIILGGHNLDEPNDQEIKIESTDLILHEEFTYTVSNDIALIRLPFPIRFNKAIKPVDLPTFRDKGRDLTEQFATVSGWGKTEGSSGISNVLLSTDERVITNDLCVYYFGSKVKDVHICTSGENYRGPCNGDSGGPLVINGKQVGIVSFGSSFGCMSFEFPNGYTRITEYLEWIEEHSDVKIKNY